jgi:hypothetical protein
LLIGDIFRENVDEMFGPMSDFAYIPPSLTAETFAANGHNGTAPDILAAKFDYYEDRVAV